MDLSEGQAEDARSHRRYPVSFKSEFSAAQAPDGSGFILDLSSGGCKVNSPLSVPPGTHMTLRIMLQEEDVGLELKGVSRWTSGMQFGVEFIEMSQEVRDRLDQVLKRLETSH